MRKLLFVLLFLSTPCACGSHLGSTPASNPRNFSIVLPEGWREIKSPHYLMITREGALSQYILVQQRRIDKPFRHTKKTFNKDMLPRRAAEVIMDEISLDSRVMNFRLIECVQAQVNHYNGFRMVFTYKEKDELNFKTAFYGLLQGNWFYSLRYSAEAKKYSAHDIKAFQEVLNSFTIERAQPT